MSEPVDWRARLADPQRNEVERVEEQEVEAVKAAAGELGFAAVELDLTGADKVGVLDRFADALQFPSWFGRNWDALYDCLVDLSWLSAPGYAIIVRGFADLRARVPADAEVVREILDEAVAQHAKHGVAMTVFLVAP